MDEGAPSLSNVKVAPQVGLKPQAVYRNLSPAELYEQVGCVFIGDLVVVWRLFAVDEYRWMIEIGMHAHLCVYVCMQDVV